MNVQGRLHVALVGRVPVEFAFHQTNGLCLFSDNVHFMLNASSLQHDAYLGFVALMGEQFPDELLEGIPRRAEFKNGAFQLVSTRTRRRFRSQTFERQVVDFARGQIRPFRGEDIFDDFINQIFPSACSFEGQPELVEIESLGATIRFDEFKGFRGLHVAKEVTSAG